VYTIFVLVGLAVAAASSAPAARGQAGITIEPAMTKGPANARVTILEFSDYQ
jgi:hypothetical protein